MNIAFNDQICHIKDRTSIRFILNDRLGDQQKGIAVAVNETVVPREQWDTYELQNNDKVLVIKATQGG